MLSSKIAIVTGGAKGIGRAVAQALARRGASVAILDIDYENASKAANEVDGLGSKGLAIQMDMANVSQIRDSVRMVADEFGRVDILVNNAGIVLTTEVEQIAEGEWRKVLDINLNGAFFMSQAVIPHMRAQGSGRIINVASLAGRTGSLVAGCHYGTAKAGMIGMTWCLARVLARDNITVNTIAPGPVWSEITKGYTDDQIRMLERNSPLGKIGRPDSIAEAVVFLCSDAADYITGATIDINGGLFMG